MLPTRVVKVSCRVSVRIRLPEMNVTPRTIARAVSASLSLWARSPLRVTLRMSAPQFLHPLQHRVGRRGGQFAYHVAVGEEHDPVGVGGSVRIMGDHDDRLPELTHRS